MTVEGLPRPWRLARGGDIRLVLRDGSRHRSPRLDIAWRANHLDHPRLSVVVPRFGHSAVARNRLRRRIREHLRRAILPWLPALDLVIRTRPLAYECRPAELRADLNTWQLEHWGSREGRGSSHDG